MAAARFRDYVGALDPHCLRLASNECIRVTKSPYLMLSGKMVLGGSIYPEPNATRSRRPSKLSSLVVSGTVTSGLTMGILGD